MLGCAMKHNGSCGDECRMPPRSRFSTTIPDVMDGSRRLHSGANAVARGRPLRAKLSLSLSRGGFLFGHFSSFVSYQNRNNLWKKKAGRLPLWNCSCSSFRALLTASPT